MLLDALIWIAYIAVFVWLARKGQGHDALTSGRVGFGIQAFAYVATYISAVALVGFGGLAYAYGLQPEPAPCTPESLIPGFSWAKVPKQDVCLPEGLF